jgi:hypothetical protein
MKPLENVWSGLVQRRLLPVAILLLGALVAVPFLLAKDPQPVVQAPEPAAQNSATADAVADPVVQLADASTDGAKPRRRVLGASKNPFQPAAAPKVKATPTPESQAGSSSGDGAGTGDKPADSGSGSSPASSPGTTPGGSTAPAPEPKPTYEVYSLTVRFGDSSATQLEKSNLPRLKALPSAEDPVLVYLGPGKDAKTAVFLLDEGVEVQGDGTCQPSPRNCETLHMHVGDTEFLDVKDEKGAVTAQYQLDLLSIKTRRTKNAAEAWKSRAKVSGAGRRVVRSRTAASGPLRYRYDAKSGTVRKLPARVYKSLLAKSARVALGTAGGF